MNRRPFVSRTRRLTTVLFVCSTLPALQSAMGGSAEAAPPNRTGQATTTVPAPAFLSRLASQGIRATEHGDAAARRHQSGCMHDRGGRFTATAGGPGARRTCSFDLLPGVTALAPGWRIARLHWSGDVEALSSRRGSDDSGLALTRITLARPVRAGERYEVRLVAVVFEGPTGRSWPEALIF